MQEQQQKRIEGVAMQYSQDFDVEGVEPPDVGVEDEVVDAEPVAGVLGDGVPLDDPVGDAVHLGVVGVGLHQEGRPVELHCGVVLLHDTACI